MKLYYKNPENRKEKFLVEISDRIYIRGIFLPESPFISQINDFIAKLQSKEYIFHSIDIDCTSLELINSDGISKLGDILHPLMKNVEYCRLFCNITNDTHTIDIKTLIEELYDDHFINVDLFNGHH